MTVELIKRMMDACYQAKRCGICSRRCKGRYASYIHYLDSIQKLEQQGVQVKVSDLSDALNLPRPGVTRTVKEMEPKAT